MGIAAVSRNTLRFYVRSLAAAPDQPPPAAAGREDEALPLPKAGEEGRALGSGAYIDIQAESVAETRIAPGEASLALLGPASAPPESDRSSKEQENSSSPTVLQYAPSSRSGGGIELRYSRLSYRGNALDLMA